MQTNTPNGKKFKMANGTTMTRDEILALKKTKSTIIASGTFGKTTVHSPILIPHGNSLITIDSDSADAGITIATLDIAVIKATHITRMFGSAKIGNSKKA